MKLLLGTTNLAKAEEYKKYLVRADLELLTLKGIRFTDEPLEIGKTFAENALQKARFYAERTEYPTLGDDGGFEVDALDGRPGVDSHRWVGPNGTDEDRINKVLKLMAGVVPIEQRTARMKVAITVYFPQQRDYVTSEAAIEGVIPKKPSPTLIPHFPYRSLLFLPEFNKYFVDLTDEEHEQVNHRKKATKEVLLKLEPYINS